MAVDVIRTIASVGSWIRGSSVVSTETFSVPCQVTAFMARLLVIGRDLSPLAGCPQTVDLTHLAWACVDLRNICDPG
ncbi:hypothetical protein Ais01nite_00610 [Asanoa ishikariensis]|nr:hypothetical protein Ais01nite_00610 [Asanoa ishikariensis]